MRFSRFLLPIFVSFCFILILIFSVNAQIAGAPDASFGTNGIAASTLRQSASFTDLAVQADKKIVVIGTTRDILINSPIYNTVARFNENGTLDTTFSENGYNDALNFTGAISRVALQPDGKIVIAGTSPAGQFAVLRLTADGNLDTGFGTDGLVTTPFGFYSEARSLNISADGKILVAGIYTAAETSPSDFGLIRYNSDGSLDSTFGAGGKVFTQLNGHEWANDSVIQADGKIIAVGRYSDTITGLERTALVRYLADGSLDPSFGVSGSHVFDSGGASRVALQNNGMFVVAGQGSTVRRFKSNGFLDAAITTAISNPNSIAVQADGKILVGGETASLTNVIQKFNRNGTPSLMIQTDYLVKKVALAPDHKIVAGGQKFNGSGIAITLGRYLNRLYNPVNLFDIEGDSRSDVAVYRAGAVGNWYALLSSSNNFWGFQAGDATSAITPADFDGDERIDTALYSNGFWYRINSSNGGYISTQLGAAGDIPIPADFDADGKADLSVFRPSTGEWFRLNSSNGQFVAVSFGTAGDKPLLGDFDGDLKADIAVYRPSNGYWYRLNSSNGQFIAVNFGIATDLPVPADYDGDGKTDIAVYRDGNWYRLNSSDGSFTGAAFGTATDKPVAADYDGDGKADIGVFRPSDGTWYLLRSTSGFAAQTFGTNGDIPIPNAFVR